MAIPLGDPPIRTSLTPGAGALAAVWEAFFRGVRAELARLAAWVLAPSVATLVNTGYYEGVEMVAPGPGAVDTVRIYAEDDGAGKTRVMVQFATGAPIQIAIQV